MSKPKTDRKVGVLRGVPFTEDHWRVALFVKICTNESGPAGVLRTLAKLFPGFKGAPDFAVPKGENYPRGRKYVSVGQGVGMFRSKQHGDLLLLPFSKALEAMKGLNEADAQMVQVIVSWPIIKDILNPIGRYWRDKLGVIPEDRLPSSIVGWRPNTSDLYPKLTRPTEDLLVILRYCTNWTPAMIAEHVNNRFPNCRMNALLVTQALHWKRPVKMPALDASPLAMAIKSKDTLEEYGQIQLMWLVVCSGHFIPQYYLNEIGQHYYNEFYDLPNQPSWVPITVDALLGVQPGEFRGLVLTPDGSPQMSGVSNGDDEPRSPRPLVQTSPQPAVTVPLADLAALQRGELTLHELMEQSAGKHIVITKAVSQSPEPFPLNVNAENGSQMQGQSVVQQIPDLFWSPGSSGPYDAGELDPDRHGAAKEEGAGGSEPADTMSQNWGWLSPYMAEAQDIFNQGAALFGDRPPSRHSPPANMQWGMDGWNPGWEEAMQQRQTTTSAQSFASLPPANSDPSFGQQGAYGSSPQQQQYEYPSPPQYGLVPLDHPAFDPNAAFQQYSQPKKNKRDVPPDAEAQRGRKRRKK